MWLSEKKIKEITDSAEKTPDLHLPKTQNRNNNCDGRWTYIQRKPREREQEGGGSRDSPEKLFEIGYFLWTTDELLSRHSEQG